MRHTLALLLLFCFAIPAAAIEKNVASQKIEVFAFTPADGLPATGDAANLTLYVAIDGGSVTALTDTSATEKSSTNAPGIYQFDLSQAETNGNDLTFSGKSATSGVIVVGRILTTTPPSFASAALATTTGVSAVETDTQDIQARLPASLSGGRMRSDAEAISGNSTAADNLQSMFDGQGWGPVLASDGANGESHSTTKLYLNQTPGLFEGNALIDRVVVFRHDDTVNIVTTVRRVTANTSDAGGDYLEFASLPFTPAENQTSWVLLAAADDADLSSDIAAIKTRTDRIPNVAAGASGGLFIAGSNAATTVNITGNLTGNVTGSVGSVATGGITADSIAANAITSSEIADGALPAAKFGAGVLFDPVNDPVTVEGLESAALTQILTAMVTEDTGETEAAAGSVALLSQGEAGSLTAEAVATEVWNGASANYVDAGGLGELLASAYAKTANLPDDPADQSALAAILGTPIDTDLATDIANVEAAVGGLDPAVETRDLEPVQFAWKLNPRTSGSAMSVNRLRIAPGETIRCSFDCAMQLVLPNGAVLATMSTPTSSSVDVDPTELGIDPNEAKLEVTCADDATVGDEFIITCEVTNNLGGGPIMLLGRGVVVAIEDE